MTNYQPLSRPKYFSGQLLTAEDLQSEQTYHLEKQRRHNRSLHGHGVVWGLEVGVSSLQDGAAQQVLVSPGFAIDPNGDEILVPGLQKADLPPDGDEKQLWVVLCYKEIPAEIVPVPGEPDGSENGTSSRVKESFELCLVNDAQDECGCPVSLSLARLFCGAQGWALDRFYQPPRSRRFDEKIIWAASLLGGAVGLLVGMLLSNTKRH